MELGEEPRAVPSQDRAREQIHIDRGFVGRNATCDEPRAGGRERVVERQCFVGSGPSDSTALTSLSFWAL